MSLPARYGASKFAGSEFTLNWTDVGGTSPFFIYLAIEAEPACDDVLVGTVRAASITTTGNQDFTDSDLGGLTPKAAIFFFTPGAVTEDTAANHIQCSIGFCDFATDHVIAWSMENGQSSGEPSMRSRVNSVMLGLVPGATTIESEAAFVSFIPDGVRVNWSDAPPEALIPKFLQFRHLE